MKYFYFSLTFIAAAGIGFVCLLALQRNCWMIWHAARVLHQRKVYPRA